MHSFEGEPRIRDKFRYWKLKYFYKYKEENLNFDSKFYQYFIASIKYFLTIGLSGCLLVLPTYCTNCNNNEKEELNENLQTIIKLEKEINESIKKNTNAIKSIDRKIKKKRNKKRIWNNSLLRITEP